MVYRCMQLLLSVSRLLGSAVNKQDVMTIKVDKIHMIQEHAFPQFDVYHESHYVLSNYLRQEVFGRICWIASSLFGSLTSGHWPRVD